MAAFVPGLVSITFRALSPAEVIALVVQAGLKAIEWGGDIHVPHGDIVRAQEVARLTRDAGLTVAAYGSYYRLGSSEAAGLPFEKVLASAVELGAPTIRVWAGVKGSAEVTEEERAAIVADGLRVADLAQARGLNISLEYHAGTLTDTRDSAARFSEELPHPAIDFIWQPSNGEDEASCIARLHDILPRVRQLHVFHWWPTAAERRPLAEGEPRWRHYLDIARSTGKPMPCLIEFVQGDRLEAFLQDAATLRSWLS